MSIERLDSALSEFVRTADLSDDARAAIREGITTHDHLNFEVPQSSGILPSSSDLAA